MPAKHGADTTDIRGSEAKIYTEHRQYLGDVSFFKMTALRVSIAETLSTVHQSQRACPTLWGRVEKLRAFAFVLLLIIII